MENKKNQKRILIVDDEENMRHMLTAMLKKFGYAVDSAVNGAAALEMIKSEIYDFILCDIKMQEMDGMEVLEKMLELPKDVPVIMISGHGDIEIAVEAIRAGAYDFISKPFDNATLCRVVQKGLEFFAQPTSRLVS